MVRMGVMSMKIMVKVAMMDGGDEYEDNGEGGNDGSGEDGGDEYEDNGEGGNDEHEDNGEGGNDGKW